MHHCLVLKRLVTSTLLTIFCSGAATAGSLWDLFWQPAAETFKEGPLGTSFLDHGDFSNELKGKIRSLENVSVLFVGNGVSRLPLEIAVLENVAVIIVNDMLPESIDEIKNKVLALDAELQKKFIFDLGDISSINKRMEIDNLDIAYVANVSSYVCPQKAHAILDYLFLHLKIGGSLFFMDQPREFMFRNTQREWSEFKRKNGGIPSLEKFSSYDRYIASRFFQMQLFEALVKYEVEYPFIRENQTIPWLGSLSRVSHTTQKLESRLSLKNYRSLIENVGFEIANTNEYEFIPDEGGFVRADNPKVNINNILYISIVAVKVEGVRNEERIKELSRQLSQEQDAVKSIAAHYLAKAERKSKEDL